MKKVPLLLLLAFAQSSVFAEKYFQMSAASAPAAFEVATVKPADPKTGYVALFTYPGGRITATGYSLRQLIHEAFKLQDFQISGGPAWIDNDKWDIQAKPPAGSKASEAVPLPRRIP